MAEPTDLKYAKTHEWVRIERMTATVGISQHAQEELGDVALVMLPEVGRIVQRGEKFGEIESIKAVSDLYAPISGEVTEVNETLKPVAGEGQRRALWRRVDAEGQDDPARRCRPAPQQYGI